MKTYEADAMIDDQAMIAVEVKCRVEQTELGKTGIVGRREACDQLPTDRPSVVWVRVPAVYYAHLSASFRVARPPHVGYAGRRLDQSGSSVPGDGGQVQRARSAPA